MRSITLIATLLITSPALISAPAMAHPSHVETAGGHSHWFELAVGGLAVLALAVWLVSKISRNPVAHNG